MRPQVVWKSSFANHTLVQPQIQLFMPITQSLRFAICLGFCFMSWTLSTLLAQPVMISGTPEEPETTSTLRAVVIGISAYADPAIRQLKYAHLDAGAFADYLRSDASGQLPKEIRTLINEEATLAAVDDALNWLKTSSEEGDMAILYFAGHGDVEVSAYWQLGYLLSHDSPPNNFRNNAIRVEDIDLLAIELSSVKNVKTLFFLDACRSGTLSEGRQVPHEHLAKQKANEVRILSCKADQLSLEGQDWGGGRGVFSYHLIRGLQGLANDEDNSADLSTVTIEELKDYLRNTVVKETKRLEPPQRQDPVIVAENESFPLAQVVPEILAHIQTSQQGDDMALAMSDSGPGGRGMDNDLVLLPQKREDPVDILFSSVQEKNLIDSMNLEPLVALPPLEVPDAFMRALADAARQKGVDTETQYKLDNFWDLADVDNTDTLALQKFNMRVAIALHNRGQEIINAYLNADPDDLEERAIQKFETTKYRWYPQLFKMVLNILPDGHPLKDRLAVKDAYFSGAAIRILAVGLEDRSEAYAEALALQKKALALDDRAPYVHNELGIIYKQLGQLDLAEEHFKVAQELAPSWGLPFSNMCALLIRQNRLDEAQVNASKAMALVPHYSTIHLHQGRIHELNGQFLDAEGAYLRCTQLAPQHFAGFERLGYLYQQTAEFAKANANFVTAEELKKGLPVFLTDADLDSFSDVLDLWTNAPLRTIEQLLALIEETPDDPSLHYELGMVYSQNNRYEDAVDPFLTVIQLDPHFMDVYDHLAWTYTKLGQYEHAERALTLAYERTDEMHGREMFLAFLSEQWERWDKAEEIYRSVIERDTFYRIGYQKLGALYEATNRFQEAELLYQLYQRYLPENGRNALYLFYLRMMERMPGQASWTLRSAQLLYENCMTITTRRPEESYIGTLHGETKTPLEFELVTDYYFRSYTQNAVPIHRDLIIWPACCERPLELMDKAYPYLVTSGEKSDIRQKQGDIYLRLDDRDNAERHFEQALHLSPSQEDLRDKVVESYVARYQLSKARSHLSHQDSLDHLLFPVHLDLVRMDNLHGDYQEARELLEKTRTLLLDEDQHLVLNWLEAQNAYLDGNLSHAIELYERSHESDPENGVHAYANARIYAVRKDNRNAFRWLDRALDSGFGEYTWVLARDPWMDSLRPTRKWRRKVGG